MMTNLVIRIFLCYAILFMNGIEAYDIPRWYRAYHWSDEPRFIKDELTTIMGTFFGGNHHVCMHNLQRLSVADFWFDWYQNIKNGFFIHTQLPWSWQRLHYRTGSANSNAGLCYPNTTVGIAQSYQNFDQLDFLDTTFQLGVIWGTPKDRLQGPIPQAITSSPGLLMHASGSIGCFEWATIGCHMSGFAFPNCGLASGGIYAQADHLIPTISLAIAVVVDGQIGNVPLYNNTYQFNDLSHESNVNRTIIAPYIIHSWYMVTFSLNAQINTATDTDPNRPFFHIFCNTPIANHNSIGLTTTGGIIGIQGTWIW